MLASVVSVAKTAQVKLRSGRVFRPWVKDNEGGRSGSGKQSGSGGRDADVERRLEGELERRLQAGGLILPLAFIILNPVPKPYP